MRARRCGERGRYAATGACGRCVGLFLTGEEAFAVELHLDTSEGGVEAFTGGAKDPSLADAGAIGKDGWPFGKGLVVVPSGGVPATAVEEGRDGEVEVASEIAESVVVEPLAGGDVEDIEEDEARAGGDTVAEVLDLAVDLAVEAEAGHVTQAGGEVEVMGNGPPEVRGVFAFELSVGGAPEATVVEGEAGVDAVNLLSEDELLALVEEVAVLAGAFDVVDGKETGVTFSFGGGVGGRWLVDGDAEGITEVGAEGEGIEGGRRADEEAHGEDAAEADGLDAGAFEEGEEGGGGGDDGVDGDVDGEVAFGPVGEADDAGAAVDLGDTEGIGVGVFGDGSELDEGAEVVGAHGVRVVASHVPVNATSTS